MLIGNHDDRPASRQIQSRGEVAGAASAAMALPGWCFTTRVPAMCSLATSCQDADFIVASQQQVRRLCTEQYITRDPISASAFRLASINRAMRLNEW